MRIASISCNNVKGFADFSIECGDVNVVAGKNAGGKSSALALVTALFGKGNPDILRAGCDHGTVSARFESDDKTEHWDVLREYVPGKVETPKVTSSSTGKIGAPAAFLKQLVDPISIEPISKAMQASPDEQITILLSTIPTVLDPKQLAEAAGSIDVPGLKAHLQNAGRLPNGLDAVNNVHKAIYDARRDVNRDAKVKRTHADELLAALPEDAKAELQVDWKGETERRNSARIAKEREENDARASVISRFTERSAEIQRQETDAKAEIDSIIDGHIWELERQRAEQKEILASAISKKREAAGTEKAEAIDAVQQKYAPERERLAADHATAEKSWMEQAGHERTRAISVQNAREAAVLEEKSAAMTKALDRLDALRLQLLSRLDQEIPGLSVESGSIAIKGVPLSQLNTAEQGKFWLQIGVRRASELGVVCADGMEAFDDDTFQSIVEGALQTGLQFFMGRVDNKPFRVETINLREVGITV